eukprot:8960700-Alexandrium_andersonii.AAC.1
MADRQATTPMVHDGEAPGSNLLNPRVVLAHRDMARQAGQERGVLHTQLEGIGNHGDGRQTA